MEVNKKEPKLSQLIEQMRDLADQIAEHRHDILKLPTSDFIRSFVDLTQAVEQMDATREVLLGKAETMLNRPRETERKLRKEHLKLVHNRK